MNTQQHTRTAIATGTCLTFGLAVAVAVGAVPQANESGSAAPVAPHGVVQPALARLLLNQGDVAKSHHAAAHSRRVMYASHPQVQVDSITRSRSAKTAEARKADPVDNAAVEPVAATGPSADTANIKHVATKHKKHHHKKKHHHHKAKKPATPQKAARTTPSASAVSNAISGLRNFVHTPLTPTSAQVAQFGDAVCTAFDQNKTFSQVKAQILAQVQKLPFTTVTSGAADYVVKTAVSLYCPGYKSKVS